MALRHIPAVDRRLARCDTVCVAGTFAQGPYMGFAELHLQFAGRVAAVLGLGLHEALRTWTPACRLSGCEWDHGDAPDARMLARAYALQLASYAHRPGVGCFAYQLEDAGRTLRLHFSATRHAGALKPAHLEQRRGELLAVLDHARAAHPGVRQVRGGSWLYNLPGYRALFPPAALAAAVPADPRDELEFMALWGQFLRGDATVYQASAATFRQRFSVARDERGLLAAFPLPKLDWQAPIAQIDAWLSHGARA